MSVKHTRFFDKKQAQTLAAQGVAGFLRVNTEHHRGGRSPPPMVATNTALKWTNLGAVRSVLQDGCSAFCNSGLRRRITLKRLMVWLNGGNKVGSLDVKNTSCFLPRSYASRQRPLAFHRTSRLKKRGRPAKPDVQKGAWKELLLPCETHRTGIPKSNETEPLSFGSRSRTRRSANSSALRPCFSQISITE